MTLTSDTARIDVNTDGSYRKQLGWLERYYHPLGERLARHIFIEKQRRRGNLPYYQQNQNWWAVTSWQFLPVLLEDCHWLLYELACRIESGHKLTEQYRKFLQKVSELKEN